MTFRYKRTFADQVKVNDIVKYSNDHYDVSLVEKKEDHKVRIRGISFFRDSILDKEYDSKYEFDVLQINSVGVFN